MRLGNMQYILANYRKLLLGGLLGVVTLVVLFSYFMSFGKLHIDNPNNVTVRIYRVGKDNPEVSSSLAIQDKNLVKQVSTSSEFRLKKGLYIITNNSSENSNYKQQIKTSRVTNKLTTINIDPDFSAEQLVKILKSEQNNIDNVIKKEIPGITKYAVSNKRLYKKGDWFGVVITEKQKNKETYNIDKFRIILHKEKGAWVVATNPPQLVFSKLNYPNIPKDVLSNVNSL